MFLDDKASDDGSGIWCSKGTIQRDTELGESTVKRTINDFLREGFLIETSQRRCQNGHTVTYRIFLAKIPQLETTAEPDIETGSTVDPQPADCLEFPHHHIVARRDQEAASLPIGRYAVHGPDAGPLARMKVIRFCVSSIRPNLGLKTRKCKRPCKRWGPNMGRSDLSDCF